MKNLIKVITLSFGLVLAAQSVVAEPVAKKSNYISGSFAFGRTHTKSSVTAERSDLRTEPAKKAPVNGIFNSKHRNTLGGALAFGGYLNDQIRGELSFEMSQHKFNVGGIGILVHSKFAILT